VLDNAEEIAIKRLARSSREETENPMKEVTLLAKLRHPNLVKLLGFCIQEEEMLLCYEYMPNRSLDQLMFGTKIFSVF
jgi:serine/threonine protein kinase